MNIEPHMTASGCLLTGTTAEELPWIFFSRLNFIMQFPRLQRAYMSVWRASTWKTGWTSPHMPKVAVPLEARNPTVYVMEFAITPFDLMLLDDREASVASDLNPGMMVGFNIGVNDIDKPGELEEFYNLFWPTDWTPDGFGDGFLLPSDGDKSEGSVVHSVSWARIKATLQD